MLVVSAVLAGAMGPDNSVPQDAMHGIHARQVYAAMHVQAHQSSDAMALYRLVREACVILCACHMHS